MLIPEKEIENPLLIDHSPLLAVICVSLPRDRAQCRPTLGTFSPKVGVGGLRLRILRAPPAR